MYCYWYTWVSWNKLFLFARFMNQSKKRMILFPTLADCSFHLFLLRCINEIEGCPSYFDSVILVSDGINLVYQFQRCYLSDLAYNFIIALLFK